MSCIAAIFNLSSNPEMSDRMEETPKTGNKLKTTPKATVKESFLGVTP